MTGQVWPKSIVASERVLQAQRDLNEHYTREVEFMPFWDGTIKPPTHWQRLRYQLKRPWWAFQSWVCRHICDCD